MSVSSWVPARSGDQPDAQATFCATCVDEWVRAGVTDAIVCPGSRSTPLALALARDGRVRVHVRLDERSAGFFALGASLATGRPVVVCTTSGTAAAELHPAVVEAFHAGVALLICTANRPPRLQQVSAPQVIDQAGLYGSAVLWSAAPGVPLWSGRDTWRSLASRAVAESRFGPLGRGPVHLDLAFDEPLSGTPAELPAGRPGGAPWHEIADDGPGPAAGPLCAPGLSGSTGARTLFVVGNGCGPSESVLGAAGALGAPVVADPLSGCRVRSKGVIAAADSLLRDDAVAATLRPDLVVRLGGLHASKVLAGRLHEWDAAGTRQLLVDGRWRWPDPERDASVVVRAEPARWCEEVRAFVEQSPTVRDQAWFESWLAAESEAQETIEKWCADHEEATEPGLARCLPGAIPPEATLVVSSSMPVRDLEWYAPVSDTPSRILSNRGANGIDGVVSTAMGVAHCGGGPVVAVVGDLAFLHDLTAWVGPRLHDRGVVVVVVDNGGGGIFSFLPQHDLVDRETFEALFGTPQTIEIASVARGLGLEVAEVSTIAEVEAAVRGSVSCGASCVVVVSVPGRDSNVELHGSLNTMIAGRVAARLELRGPVPGT